MVYIIKHRLLSGLACVGLLSGGMLLSGCNPPRTPDAVVANQGNKTEFITGAKTDSTGRVVVNPSTGAGGRRDLGN